MKSRKVSSQKPQELPFDFIKMVRDVVEKNYKKFCFDKKVVIDGGIYMQEITFMVGFANKSGVKQVNFCASMDFDLKKKDIVERLNTMLDSLGSMIEQYVEADGDIELPTEWTDFELDGKKIFLKFDTTNTELETKADELLED
ncbi:MAG: hypothetical protein IPM57_05690 [Oligoflexia bacterium]|nr:hypothetical protein [Oligoflexia bacterium]